MAVQEATSVGPLVQHNIPDVQKMQLERTGWFIVIVGVVSYTDVFDHLSETKRTPHRAMIPPNRIRASVRTENSWINTVENDGMKARL